jgi:hypothetical protein
MKYALLVAPSAIIAGCAFAAEPPCPRPGDPQFGCNTPSGFVVADHDYQVISGLEITATASGQPGINTNGHSYVKICSVKIHHSNGGAFDSAPGVFINGGAGVELHNVNIVDESGGPGHPPATDANVKILNSGGPWLDNVRVSYGAWGVEANNAPGGNYQVIEGYGMTGDHEANGSGTFIQILNTNTGVTTIQDFYLTNPNLPINGGGTNGDGVSAYKSSHVRVYNGVVDGLWGWASCAVQDDINTNDMTVNNVTTFNTTDGAFCVYGSGGKTANYGPNLYAANNQCNSVQNTPRDGHLPLSGAGYMFVGPCKSVKGGCSPPGSKPKAGVSMVGSYYGWQPCPGFATAPPYLNLPNRFTQMPNPPLNNHIKAAVCKD